MTMRCAYWGVVVVTLTTGLGAAALQAQPSWLPADVETALVGQLAERLTSLPPGPNGPLPQPVRQERAGQAVRALRGLVETWGLDTVVAKAPKLEGVPVPASSNRWLDAMGRYQFCAFVLAVQGARDPDPGDFNLRFTGVMGTTGTTMAVLYLRQPFVAGGGTAAAMEAHMTSSAMEALGARLQQDADLLTAAQEGCAPVIIEMVTTIIG